MLIALGHGKWAVTAEMHDGAPALLFRETLEAHTPGALVPRGFIETLPVRAVVTFADDAAYRRFLTELPGEHIFPAENSTNSPTEGRAATSVGDAPNDC